MANTDKLIFPVLETGTLTLSQGPGISRKLGTLEQQSHTGYRATDMTNNIIYAPCDLRCTYYGDLFGAGYKVTFYETVNPVKCADGRIRDFTMELVHGGSKFVSTVNDIYYKNKPIYYSGTDGDVAEHIHMEIYEGKVPANELSSCFENIKQPNWGNQYVKAFTPKWRSLNFDDVFFKGSSQNVIYKYNCEGEFSFVDESRINTFYDSQSWYQHPITGDWYSYGSDLLLQRGWVANPDGWFYLDYVNGKMLSNTWIQADNKTDWYWLLSDGKMAANQWVQVGGKWYYFLSSGKMIYNDSLYIDGKMYYFRADGSCENK